MLFPTSTIIVCRANSYSLHLGYPLLLFQWAFMCPCQFTWVAWNRSMAFLPRLCPSVFREPRGLMNPSSLLQHPTHLPHKVRCIKYRHVNNINNNTGWTMIVAKYDRPVRIYITTVTSTHMIFNHPYPTSSWIPLLWSSYGEDIIRFNENQSVLFAPLALNTNDTNSTLT